MILAAERPKHPRSGRPVCVQPEPGRSLGPDRSLAVVARGDLDIHSAAPPLGVDVLDLRIGVENTSLLVDGELQLPGGLVPLGVRGPATVSRTRGLAPARDSALELAVEPYAPDGSAPLEQALAFAVAGPVDGRVVRELGVLEEAGDGPDVLSGVQAVPGVQVAEGEVPAVPARGVFSAMAIPHAVGSPAVWRDGSPGDPPRRRRPTPRRRRPRGSGRGLRPRARPSSVALISARSSSSERRCCPF